MKNKSISDFVAASMDAVLNSDSHKSLFMSQYTKIASDQNEAKDKCAKCNHPKDECTCGDSMAADDNEARKAKKDSSDDSSKDSNRADDASDSSEEKTSAAFDVAIDSLLTASAALDSVGLDKGSALSLKLASLVVEAKKKDSSKDKEKAAKEKAKAKAAKEKEKEKKDSQAAKDKAAKEKAKAKAAKEKDKASKEKDSKKSSGNSSKK